MKTALAFMAAAVAAEAFVPASRYEQRVLLIRPECTDYKKCVRRRNILFAIWTSQSRQLALVSYTHDACQVPVRAYMWQSSSSSSGTGQYDMILLIVAISSPLMMHVFFNSNIAIVYLRIHTNTELLLYWYVRTRYLVYQLY